MATNASNNKFSTLSLLNILPNHPSITETVIWKKRDRETKLNKVNTVVSTIKNFLVRSIFTFSSQSESVLKTVKSTYTVNNGLPNRKQLLLPIKEQLYYPVTNLWKTLQPTSNLETALVFITLNKKSAHLSNQIRYFKTLNRGKMDSLKNLTILSRIQSFLGFTNSTVSGKPSTISLIKELQKFQMNIRKENVSPEMTQKLILAFVEGYSFAIDSFIQHKASWKMYNVYLTLCIVALVVALLRKLSLTRGSMTVNYSTSTTKFSDVKGADEAKQELKSIVEFLKTPEKFSALGGKLPKGVLLVGPPGTGKTLLAKAVAGEAGVPFFYTSGSEFDEIYVGVGAKRLRELFKVAKENTPCVIFIDEIDSIGKQRTSSARHPHANDTVNQLLSEMDGFKNSGGVIVLGATNRKEDLDKALLRPGRFDVEVAISPPDYRGRKQLLEFYLGKVRHQDVDVDKLARGTTNFTGADIENMVNQAAVRAAGDGADYVSTQHLEYARDKALMGPESLSRVVDEETNRVTAYHEGGHALVAHYTQHAPPLHKVTIIARGSSLGHTAYIPDRDVYHVTRGQLLASLDITLGGRAAEEVVFGPDRITSGAASDLEKATELAGKMVRRWGMSEGVGLPTYHRRTIVSPDTANAIDTEIKALLQESYERAKTILITHKDKHKDLSEALLQFETLDAHEVAAILKDD